MRARHATLWLMLFAAAVNVAAAADVVANRDATYSEISRPFLRGMFGMRVRAWPDGTPVRVYVLPDSHSTHVEFCTEVLQMYPYQLRQNWDRLVYSGTGQPPVEVATPEELLRRVAETPGAIGYLGAQNRGAVTGPVRVLDVR